LRASERNRLFVKLHNCDSPKQFWIHWQEPSLYSPTLLLRICVTPLLSLWLCHMLCQYWDQFWPTMDTVAWRSRAAMSEMWRRYCVETWRRCYERLQPSPAYSEVAVDEVDDAPHCRFCFGTDQPLLSPCECRGSSAFVHERCLQTWMLHSTAEASRVRCDVCQTPYSPEVAQLGPSRSKRRIRWLASGCLRFFQHFFVLYPLIVVFTIQGLLGCLLFLQSCELGRPLDAMHILLWHIADMSFFRLFFTDLTYKNLVSVFKQRRGWVVELWGFPVCVVAIFLTVAMTAACLTLIKGVLWLQGVCFFLSS